MRTQVLELLRAMREVTCREISQVLNISEPHVYQCIATLRLNGYIIMTRRGWPVLGHRKRDFPNLVKFYSLYVIKGYL